MSLVPALWLLPVLAWPLLLAGVALLPGVRTRALMLLPSAALPGLAAAVLAPEGVTLQLPDMLLGAQLSLGGQMRPLLGFAALLWTAAGGFAARALHDDPRPARFATFWCLTLVGSLGVFLADDVVTFYAAFACVSLAAYPLVVHTATAAAMRAGRVYIVLALAGETCLLLGFMLAASGAQSLLIADVRQALAAATGFDRHAALALLLAGFGIKAGLVPLHVWLPLAHPAAPTPASAVLSGVIVKAGIVGLMQFLPLGVALPAWQGVLLAAGLGTAFFGIVLGLAQDNPKAMLAYSTISQMGLVVTLLAAVLMQGNPQPALAAAGLYTVHHGLAKGALFLGVGVVAACGRRVPMVVLAALALPALSLAGAPLTGGALAKLDAKPLLGDGLVATAFTLSAIGTALLMLRVLRALAVPEGDTPASRPARGLWMPWLATVLACIALPWWLFVETGAQPAAIAWQPGTLWAGAWPIGLALGMAALALRLRRPMPSVPPGDLLLWAERAMRALAVARPSGSREPVRRGVRGLRVCLLRAMATWTLRAEAAFSRWSMAGVLLLLLGLLLAL